ncbi:Rv3654c family TadE-like protein [Streptomyces marincola]|uniref:Putative Flp pilus-assembly TadG-like N-terminal domain-containing protein n=1 Tax=Streptomyces marincola TaxID=2878388 RepID=A0A1W7CZ19_9ACTN|nr:Rv3654c family TadE-like protein [Streptomyces marincola]ARQ69957.1 hypothetical protein CAG99_14800 [Streptomyces marincola]
MPSWAERRSAGARDRGSATVWGALCATLLCVVFGGVLALGQVTGAKQRAAGAADLAALAAADAAWDGADAACDLARRVAAAQDARVVRCHVGGEIADLTAEARAGPYTVRVRARAGPGDAAVR